MERKIISIKKWLCLSIVFWLLFGGRMTAWGDEAIEADIDRAFTQEEKLCVYVNHNRGAEFLAAADNSELFLDGQAYDIENIQTLEEANVPVSYMFLVDVSGSMDEQRIQTAKSVIHQFLDEKKEQDNFCIVTMGDTLNSSGFLDSPEEIAAWTDRITVTTEDTNLYYSIAEELKVLETEQAVRSKRCLVILSDGADDQAAGITREEAQTAVRDAHIPVFSVALLKENPTEAQIESAKFCRGQILCACYRRIRGRGNLRGYPDGFKEEPDCHNRFEPGGQKRQRCKIAGQIIRWKPESGG